MRLDKYLKVARLIKRRTVANEACDNGPCHRQRQARPGLLRREGGGPDLPAVRPADRDRGGPGRPGDGAPGGCRRPLPGDRPVTGIFPAARPYSWDRGGTGNERLQHFRAPGGPSPGADRAGAPDDLRGGGRGAVRRDRHRHVHRRGDAGDHRGGPAYRQAVPGRRGAPCGRAHRHRPPTRTSARPAGAFSADFSGERPWLWTQLPPC